MLNSLSGEGVLGVTAEDRLAAVEVGQVVDGQRRVVVEGVSSRTEVLGALLGARGRLDSDGSAVHVVFLGSGQLGCPSPCVTVRSSRDIRGDCDIVCSGGGAVLGRATTLDGQDDRPAGAGAGLHVGAQSDLAGTASMNGGALEAHGDRLACCGSVGNSRGRVECGSISTDLARVLRRGERTVGDGIRRVGDRIRQNHVTVSSAATYCQHSSSLVKEGRHDQEWY